MILLIFALIAGIIVREQRTKFSFADGFTGREMEYVSDFLSPTNNELMAYETGAGSIRTVFGHQYQRLHQNTSFLNWTSGAGFLAALLANFLGGAGGSAANQYISDGKIDPRKSITRGLTNAIEQLPYGTNPLKSAKAAFGRGFKTGAATTTIDYISDHLGLGKTALPGRMGTGLLPAVASETIIPNRLLRDPKRERNRG